MQALFTENRLKLINKKGVDYLNRNVQNQEEQYKTIIGFTKKTLEQAERYNDPLQQNLDSKFMKAPDEENLGTGITTPKKGRPVRYNEDQVKDLF